MFACCNYTSTYCRSILLLLLADMITDVKNLKFSNNIDQFEYLRSFTIICSKLCKFAFFVQGEQTNMQL